MHQRPNVLFLLSDEHSYRYLSARSYDRGGEPVHTPMLDGLFVLSLSGSNKQVRRICIDPSQAHLRRRQVTQ